MSLVQMSLNISIELNEKLENMARESQIPVADILRKAIFLMDIAFDNKKKGNHIAINDSENIQVSEILGI